MFKCSSADKTSGDIVTGNKCTTHTTLQIFLWWKSFWFVCLPLISHWLVYIFGCWKNKLHFTTKHIKNECKLNLFKYYQKFKPSSFATIAALKECKGFHILKYLRFSIKKRKEKVWKTLLTLFLNVLPLMKWSRNWNKWKSASSMPVVKCGEPLILEISFFLGFALQSMPCIYMLQNKDLFTKAGHFWLCFIYSIKSLVMK